jgi:DNA-binding GntR family transcriptional regulator
MAFKARNLPDQVAQYLSEKILSGEIQPGERVLEKNLADELGISRGPIREAFRILERSMLLDLAPRHGATVTEVSPSFAAWLHDILAQLLKLSVREAARLRTDEHVTRLQHVLQRIEETAQRDDPIAGFEGILQFLGVCQQAAMNPLLRRLLQDLEPGIRRTLSSLHLHENGDLWVGMGLLERTAQCIQQKKGEMAEDTIETYLTEIKALVIERITKGRPNQQASL